MNRLIGRWGGLALLLAPAVLGAQEIGPRVDVAQLFSGLRPRAVSAVSSPSQLVVVWDAQDVYPVPVHARRYDADGVALGPALTVNTSPASRAVRPAVASSASGAFTVVWAGHLPSLPSFGTDIIRRRFDANGVPLEPEFRVNSATTGGRIDPAIAMDAAGASVVAWVASDGSGVGIVARAFAADGTPTGGEFRVNATTADIQMEPQVALNGAGEGLVVWQSREQDGSADGVYARRVGVDGVPLGAEFRVNSFTEGIQAFPAVAALVDDGFIVAWVSTDGLDDGGPGVFAQRYDAAGAPQQGEFRVGKGPVRIASSISIAADARGGFALAWAGAAGQLVLRRYDALGGPLGVALGTRDSASGGGTSPVHRPALVGDGAGRLTLFFDLESSLFHFIEGRRYGAAWPTALSVDADSYGQSDGNGVLDPGEGVTVAPSWLNDSPSLSTQEGGASAFTGPGGPVNPAYVLIGEEATYGDVPPGGTTACAPFICFALGVTVPTTRPQQHIDATFKESLEAVPGDDATRTWSVHVGGSFGDVSRVSPYYRFAETLLHFGVSGGCSASSFCPDAATTREQMAAFLLTANLGQGYQPPRPATGVFTDVPPGGPFAPWVEEFWNRGIVEGCGPNVYCPADPVTRAQMAVMLLRTLEGTSYVPPACTTPVFNDVPCSDPFARWINALAARGITAGCGGGSYCPGGSVTRAQMAVFITRAFGLELYAPSTLAGPFEP